MAGQGLERVVARVVEEVMARAVVAAGVRVAVRGAAIEELSRGLPGLPPAPGLP